MLPLHSPRYNDSINTALVNVYDNIRIPVQNDKVTFIYIYYIVVFRSLQSKPTAKVKETDAGHFFIWFYFLLPCNYNEK